MTTQTDKTKTPKKEKDPHVLWIPPATFACVHCGEHYEMNLPAPVDVMHGAMKTFSATHKKCPLLPRGRACAHCFGFDHAIADCPQTKYHGDLQRWARGPDTGMSSIVICKRLKPKDEHVTFSFGTYGNHPLDPSDFGRCHRLLHAMPGWRARIGEMAIESPVWKNLAEHWDELEALYLEELPTGKCPKLYARMQELGA